MDDLVDTAGRDTDLLREPILADPKGLEKLLEKTSPGWIGGSFEPWRLRAVICDLDVIGISLPTEANPPLIVDADAVLPLSVPRELLKTVPGRKT